MDTNLRKIMNQEMDWEDYEKILMNRPGFDAALKETLPEYETARIEICRNISEMLFTSVMSITNAERVTSVWLSFANQKQIKNVYNRLWYTAYFKCIKRLL